MEKIDNNKTEYGYTEESICNLKTNQKPIQIRKDESSKTKRLYKTPVKLAEKKTAQQQNTEFRLLGEAKAEKSLQELKKKFCNLLMRNGEKSKAYKLFYESLKQVEDKNLVKNFDFFKQERLYIPYSFYTRKEKRNEKKKSFQSNSYTDQKQEQGIVQRKDEKNIPLKGENKNNQVFQHFYNEFLRKNTLYQAVENVKPYLELRRVRKGGTTYQVPAIVSQKRQERLAIKWIIESAEKRKKKSNNTFSNCLVSEILDAFNKTGQPKQRRDEQLKIAEFNRAYTRYRWW